MKRLLSLLLLFATPALAVDHAAGLVSSGATLETGWSQGTNKLVGTSVTAKWAYKTDATILKGHKYRWQVTTGSVTGGVLQVVVGRVRHASGGANVLAPVTGQGATPIASNFNVTATLISASPQPDSLDPVSAFRFVTGVIKYAQDDPLLYNGYPGASHLHEFACNTGVNAYSTFRSLRSSGDSGCGKANRSSYWAPAMINGNGDVVTSYYWNVYYKGWPSGGGSCSLSGPDSTHVGICVEMPNGLRFVFGMDMSNPNTTGAMSSNTRESRKAHTGSAARKPTKRRLIPRPTGFTPASTRWSQPAAPPTRLSINCCRRRSAGTEPISTPPIIARMWSGSPTGRRQPLRGTSTAWLRRPMSPTAARRTILM
jgi:hypothetical protein